MQKRSQADEDLIKAIFTSNDKFRKGSKLPNLILDARPKANAYANAAMGKGFESPEFYHNSARYFLGIENIHVMRDSLNKLLDGSFSFSFLFLFFFFSFLFFSFFSFLFFFL